MEIENYINRAVAISNSTDVSHLMLEFYVKNLGEPKDEKAMCDLLIEEIRAWANDALGEEMDAYREAEIDRVAFFRSVLPGPDSWSLYLCFPLLTKEDGVSVERKAKELAEAISATYSGPRYSYWPDIATDVNRIASDYGSKLQHPIWF